MKFNGNECAHLGFLHRHVWEVLLERNLGDIIESITSFVSNEVEIRESDSHSVSVVVLTPSRKRIFLPWVVI